MDTKNIFLFIWEKYFLDSELQRRKDWFISKFWKDSIFSYDSSSFNSDEIIHSLYSWWLFTSKKMLIIKWLPLDTYESNKINSDKTQWFIDYFKKNSYQIPDDTILIFISYKPDWRSAFLKSLKENIPSSNTKTFESLKWIQLKSFVREQLNSIKIHELDIEYFLIKIWEDLYRITYEIQKLILRCQIKNIDTIDHQTIDKVCFGMVESNTFEFFDKLFDDKEKILSLLDKIRNDWINWNHFAWTLYWWLKVYIFIIDLYNKWITDSKQIITITKLHPFVVSKNIKNIDKLNKNKNQIKNFYKNLLELDSDIKLWKFPDTYFRLWIKKLIINLFNKH